MQLTWKESRPAVRGLGDPSEALSRLYDEYGTDVLRLCFMYMKNRPDAEDAAQETFLKVWVRLDSFEGRNNCGVRSWMLRVARNTCLDLLRKRRRERTAAMEDPAWPGSASHEDRELMMDVLGLPEKYRGAVLMVYWQRMTLREAAKALGTSRSAVSRRLKKALSMLEGSYV